MSNNPDIETEYTPSTPTVEDVDDRQLTGSCISGTCND